MWQLPDPRSFDSLLDMLDDAATRYAGRGQLGLRTDEGLELRWSAAELRHRSRLAAWRLRRLGLLPGDRLLTWSPSTPALPAVYFGAMRAGVVVVPLDLRMAPDVIDRIATAAAAGWLAIGTGFDAPDPAAAGLTHLHIRSVESLCADPPHENAAGTDEGSIDEPFTADWEAQLDSWPRPDRDSLFEVIYTSGTTGNPKGVMLEHGAILSTLETVTKLLPPREERTVSLLPASHLFDQAPVLFYGLMIGADILYLRSRTPRVIFAALAEHRVTTMVVVPQLLQLFWNGLTREIARQGKSTLFERSRRVARWLPYWARRLLFRRIHRQLGGSLRLFVSAGAYLAPALQSDWESLGVIVLQGYGATECGPASATSERDHPTGSVGRTISPVRLRLDDRTGEILVAGPTLFAGYWQDDAATAGVMSDGWYHTGDIGGFDARGNLSLHGRTKNIIVLPNGFNVFPEDVENVLEQVGLAQTVVLETAPGRIEAVVLSPDTPAIIGPNSPAPPSPASDEERQALARRIDGLVRGANSKLGQHQRLDGWRLWPEPDFPRTHTLKIRRPEVQRWAAADSPLPLAELEES
jgi:long-chain acyl-CoA synthetase